MDMAAGTFRDALLFLGPELFSSNYKGVVETRNHLLALDAEGRPIEGTYLGQIEAFAPDLKERVPGQMVQVEEGFLLYATPWHTNYQHFLTETFPKVVDYLDLVQILDRVIPLLVPRFLSNAFVEEVFQLLGLQECLLYLDGPGLYRVKTLYSSSYVPNYDPVPESAVAAFRLLRDLAQDRFSRGGEPRRRLYLARDGHANPSQNNTNAGAGRVIRNEGALRARLEPYGFEDVWMGDLGIEGKVQALAGADCIVSPIGANLMNLLFLSPPYPRSVVILHSTYLTVHALWFKDLIHGIYDGQITVELCSGPAERETENSPYALEEDGFAARMDRLFRSWGGRMFTGQGVPPPLELKGDPRLAEAPVLRWVRLDPRSQELADCLPDLMETWFDRGVEAIGLASEPDLLSQGGWEDLVEAILDAGFRGFAFTEFPRLPDSRMAQVLARCEQIWSSSGVASAGLARILAAAAEAGVPPPAFCALEPERGVPSVITGSTRLCLDPWQGVVLRSGGSTHPCGRDLTSLGDHLIQPLEEILDGPIMRLHRRGLLSGQLPEACRTCPSAPWGPPGTLRAWVEAHARFVPGPEPVLTPREVEALFAHWASEGTRTVLYPAGGHTRWLLEYAPSLKNSLTALGDRDPELRLQDVQGLPVVGPEELIPDRVDLVVVAAGAAEADILASLEPVAARGVRVVSVHRLSRLWLRLQGRIRRKSQPVP